MCQFVQRVVDKLNIGLSGDRVSLVQYSREPQVHFYLNTHATKQEVLNSIENLQHQGGSPLNTGRALDYTKKNIFIASSGSRLLDGVPQILVLVTGGRSQDDVRAPAAALKQDQIVPLSIGNQNADVIQLQAISYTPGHALTVPQFDDLQTIEQKLLSYVKRVPRQPKRLPPTTTESVKRDVAFLIDGSDDSKIGFEAIRSFIQRVVESLNVEENLDRVAVVQYSRDPTANFYLSSYSTKKETMSSTPAYAFSVPDFTSINSIAQRVASVLISGDEIPEQFPTPEGQALDAGRNIVFLIDGSDDASDRFTAIREFVASLAETFDVGQEKDQIAVVQFSNTAATSFNLSTYSSSSEVADAVRNLKPKGGRPQYIGQALQFVKDNIFTPRVGSQQMDTVSQNLVLVAGGRSRDSPHGPANALKSMGVAIFAIGSRLTDPIEMEAISSQTDYAMAVYDFHDLNNVRQSLLTKLMGVRQKGDTKVDAEGDRKRRDVVFLLDGSDGTKNGFPAMKEFVQRMVEKLEVAENRDRISVVQYSRDPEAHFYLNTYTTKEEVLDSVRGLRHKGGRPLYTGAALQYVRDNVFTASSGSRRLEAVPQILVLLSGGRSFDSVEAAASSLKELGVLTFGIGSRGSDSRELQRISYDPNYALSVSDFSELPNVQEQLLASVQAVSIPITPTTPTVTAEYVAPRKDVVFLLDGSDGTRNSFPAMRDFVQRVVEQFNIEPNRDRVSVVQYSRDAEVHFYLNSYTTKEDVLDRVRGLRHKGGRPLYTGAALQYVRDNVFTASSGSRRLEGVPQVLILLNGGRSFDSVDAAASSLKELGVLTFGIGSRGSDSRELQKISYDPNYALSVSDFSELPNVQEQLLASVQAVAMPITPTTPTLTADDAIPRKDVVFLLDGSDGTRNIFPAMREFVQRVVEQFNIEANRDRVSVVQYSRDAEVNFYLNTYSTKGEILNTVRGLRHRGGRPLKTGAALQYVRDSVFTASAGSRKQEGVPQILILLSGGRSSDNIDAPASALKESGILIFGIGTRNSSREVLRIANDPTYAQSINEFSDLPSVQQQFISSLNNALEEVKPTTPTVAAEGRRQRRDVVFLLDGSDGTRNGFPAMKEFVQRMVEKLEVAENRDRVSVVQYSRDPEAHFYLNTYTTKEEVLDSVRGLRHKGGRPLYTGAALQYVRDNVFTASSGSRRLEAVPQILVLLSGGRSFDSVEAAASSLKELGVLTFGIGSRGSDSRELQRISYDPNYALSVSDFSELPNVQEQLLASVQAVSIPITPTTPTVTGMCMAELYDTLSEYVAPRKDVVFLLDGSDGTRNSFPAMRDFVQRVVEQFNIEPNRDRVSVVQYSRDAEVHFYLNSYTTKEDVLDRVRGLRHKGGRPLYTGAALQYVRDNVFTASSGSRRLEGVPQVLILLNGGRSFDSVDAAASSLKELGVLTFGIGSRGSDSRELQRISYDPNYALSVSDFSELPNVQEQLLASVQAVAMPITPTTPTLTGMCMAELYES
ncbi:collagen alpha-3(VI) chain-like [Chanodichthys erythropterus]|uniref:collagen alpha-3(VI) chain-like n=1 Tax=Chanodichthys erythropterus TaxID=933992 RepID=UPI00351E18F3